MAYYGTLALEVAARPLGIDRAYRDLGRDRIWTRYSAIKSGGLPLSHLAIE
jgi:hypothetical protein